MKVAIMTLQVGGSYGGILQAYALQKVVERLGHTAVTIDRKPEKQNIAYIVAKYCYRLTMKILKQKKEPIFIEKIHERSRKETRKFINKNIKMSHELHSTNALKDYFLLNKFEAVIVGSDQTWRPKYSANILNYYLDFIEDKKIRRIAYASSFGVNEWEYSPEETVQCKSLAQKFDAISVREASGIELCHNYLNVHATHVIDPTLLLKKEDYLALIGRTSQKPRGVLEFWLDGNEGKRNLARKIAKTTDKEVFYCQPTADLIKGNASIEPENYLMPPVEEWLSAIYDSSFVITDSFHGMVFSIIFERPFIVISNTARGSARFESLLSNLGLMTRLHHDINSVDLEKALEPIDYMEVKNKLIKMQDTSNSFLRKALSRS